MKHKYYELIVAWAEGKTIQGKVAGNINWHDMVNPAWDGIEIEYRIKPEPKPDLAFYCETYFDGKPVKTPMHPIWLTTDNLRLIYDGETGKLKKAEVLE